MRFLLTLFVLVSLALIPASVPASEPGAGPHPPTVPDKLATTIDELASMFDPKVCADCHEQIYEEWQESMHSQSMIDPRTLNTWRTFIRQGLNKEKDLTKMDLKSHCIWCHAPAIKYATDDLTAQIIDLVLTAVESKDHTKKVEAVSELSKLNLNCYGCHNLFALKDGYWGNKSEKGAIYGPKGDEDPEDPKHEGVNTHKSDYLATPKFCARCHHGCPDFVPLYQCRTLYSSYVENYVEKGGTERCQDCHMKREDNDPDNPRSHRFPGVDDKDFFAGALDIEIEAEATHFINNYKNELTPTLCMNVKLTSSSGHGIPNG
jgi:hypothetical protein